MTYGRKVKDMGLKIPLDSMPIDLSYSLVMSTDIVYVWYNSKRDEIQTFGKDAHLILTGYSFTVPYIVYLGEL